MTYDDLCQALDDMRVSGDTPLVFVTDGQQYTIDSLHTQDSGAVAVVLEED